MKYIGTKILSHLLLYSSVLLHAWQNPITLTPAWNDASVPCLSFDASGNALSIWRLFDGDFTRIQFSRYDSVSGLWSDPIFISPVPHAREPKIVVNSQGNAIAIWRLVVGKNFAVQASFYDAGTGWQVPFDLPLLSDLNHDAEIPNVALNDADKAVACWQHYDGTVWRIQSAVRMLSGDWTAPVNVSNPGFYGFSPQIVMNNEENPWVAIVFYGIMEDGGNDCVQTVTSHDGGYSWSTPKAISEINTSAYIPQVVRDASDNLIVVWQVKEDDGSWTIQARKLHNGNWLAIKNLASGIIMNDSRCPNVRIAGNAQGKACITWFSTVEENQQVVGTLYGGSDWTAWMPDVVEVSDIFVPMNRMDWPNQRVAIDGSGNSIIVWQEQNEVGDLLIHAAVYNQNQETWTQSIISQPGQDATLPFVGLSMQGQGFALWKRADGRKLASPVSRIQISRYP